MLEGAKMDSGDILAPMVIHIETSNREWYEAKITEDTELTVSEGFLTISEGGVPVVGFNTDYVSRWFVANKESPLTEVLL